MYHRVAVAGGVAVTYDVNNCRWLAFYHVFPFLMQIELSLTKKVIFLFRLSSVCVKQWESGTDFSSTDR